LTACPPSILNARRITASFSHADTTQVVKQQGKRTGKARGGQENKGKNAALRTDPVACAPKQCASRIRFDISVTTFDNELTPLAPRYFMLPATGVLLGGTVTSR
jgi:hypothetical protein